MPRFARPKGVTLHYDVAPGNPGATGGVPVVLLNSLGTDFRIWQDVVEELADVEYLRLDHRGHGLSDHGDTSIDILADDVISLMDLLQWDRAILCGVSVGGMIALSLADRYPNRVAGLILCNTGAKIGTTELWNDRCEQVLNLGLGAIADAVIARWFSPAFRNNNPGAVAGYRNMLIRTSPAGYTATCTAIRDRDLTTAARRVCVPTVCIGGADDPVTPPALLQDLAALMAGAHLHILPAVGHLPCLEAPRFVAAQIRAMQDSLL